MTEANNSDKPNETETTEAKPDTSPSEEVKLDLDAEAVTAATGKEEISFDRLEDIQDPALREAVRSYVSRSINDAKSTWDTKAAKEAASKQPTSKGGLSREEVDRMFEARDAEMRMKYEATTRLKGIFSDMNIEEGGPQHQQVIEYYSAEKEAGRLDGTTLLSEAGIRSLIHASGALLPDAQGPSSGVSQMREGLTAFDVPEVPDEIQLGGEAPSESSENDPSRIARSKMRELMGDNS
jgi:hypothetical protein